MLIRFSARFTFETKNVSPLRYSGSKKDVLNVSVAGISKFDEFTAETRRH